MEDLREKKRTPSLLLCACRLPVLDNPPSAMNFEDLQNSCRPKRSNQWEDYNCKEDRVEAAIKTLSTLYVPIPTDEEEQSDEFSQICHATAASYKSNLKGKELGIDIATRVLAVGGIKLDGTPLGDDAPVSVTV